MLAEIPSSETRQELMKAISLWCVHKKVRREGKKHHHQQQKTWSIYVLEGNTKNTLLGDFFKDHLHTLTKKGWSSSAVLVVFLCPFTEPGVSVLNSPHHSHGFWTKGLNALRCLVQKHTCGGRVSSTPRYLHSAPFSGDQ